MKTLVVFDFDDTLFHSGARVRLQQVNQPLKYLTTREYAEYHRVPSDKLDFSEFTIYPPDPKPIATTTHALRNAVFRYGIENVVILTARTDAWPVEHVLENFQMPAVDVIAIGSSNPKDKARELKNKILQNQYDRLILYEDDPRNIRAIQRLVRSILKDEFLVHHVSPTSRDV